MPCSVYGGTLHDLDPARVSGLPAALANAQAFADEAVALLAGRPDEGGRVMNTIPRQIFDEEPPRSARPDADQLRALAEKASFPSREASPAPQAAAKAAPPALPHRPHGPVQCQGLPGHHRSV